VFPANSGVAGNTDYRYFLNRLIPAYMPILLYLGKMSNDNAAMQTKIFKLDFTVIIQQESGITPRFLRYQIKLDTVLCTLPRPTNVNVHYAKVSTGYSTPCCVSRPGSDFKRGFKAALVYPMRL
jgi:hypothetical protein